MTENEQQPPEVVEGVVLPQPTDEGYICDQPGCDRTFPTLQGVSMHKIRAHSNKKWSGVPMRNRAEEDVTPAGFPVRERCDLCGKPITKARMQSHLVRVHNATRPTKRRLTSDRVEQLRDLPSVPTSRSRIPTPVPAETPRDTGGQVSDENWEQMAAVRRATAEYVRLTAERADYRLNLDQFTVDDEVVILKSSDGSRWMLRRID